MTLYSASWKINKLKKIIVFEKQQHSNELSKIVHHLITLVDCWIIVVTSWVNSQNDNYFHSKWSWVKKHTHIVMSENSCRFVIYSACNKINSFSQLNNSCVNQRVLRRESKTDSYSKDLLFLTCIAFCVITFEPIMI